MNGGKGEVWLFAGTTRISALATDDRGLSYGDGVFETIPAPGGRPFMLQDHLQRLQSGCERLQIAIDVQWLSTTLANFSRSKSGDGIVRLVVSRGVGGRGYAPPDDPVSNLMLSWHPRPVFMLPQGQSGIELAGLKTRLSSQPALAGMKHLCRLEQVLGSIELQNSAATEGLMSDFDGWAIEGTRSNVFVFESGRLITPVLDQCGVDGVFRQRIMQGRDVMETQLATARIASADELFMCNSVQGIVPVARYGQRAWKSPGPETRQLQGQIAAPAWTT